MTRYSFTTPERRASFHFSSLGADLSTRGLRFRIEIARCTLARNVRGGMAFALRIMPSRHDPRARCRRRNKEIVTRQTRIASLPRASWRDATIPNVNRIVQTQ
ncbi:hypothetical protein [Burkholderia sp. BCC1993]|uniref:hypothetical protein n=1 Tax=Burkholderia sp. BCC1993 TaxID=2817444 RepID=UPI002AAF1C1B|nr:hypothetical protein [Burkholderia sp. BCC1993]